MVGRRIAKHERRVVRQAGFLETFGRRPKPRRRGVEVVGWRLFRDQAGERIAIGAQARSRPLASFALLRPARHRRKRICRSLAIEA